MYDELEAMYQQLKATVDLAERDEIARSMGNFAFDNYISIPHRPDFLRTHGGTRR